MTPQQQEQLGLLAIFHYVFAGLLALMACVPLIHLAMGLVLLIAPFATGERDAAPVAFVGLVFVALSGFFVIAGWATAGLLAWSGRCLAQRRRYMFCLVMAGVACLFMPLGTVLGVFTIILLAKSEVKAAFNSATSSG